MSSNQAAMSLRKWYSSSTSRETSGSSVFESSVRAFAGAREPDVLLLQELKGTEFPSEAFNRNPVGSDKFAYKLAWMDRLNQQMIRWKQDDVVPTLIGGDFNVIPEDIDCHKPSLWEHDALFQPEPRARYRAMLGMGYTDAFRSLHVGEAGHFTFWDYFRQAFQNNRGIRIDHFSLFPTLANRLEGCEIDNGPRAQEKPSDHTPIIVTLSDLP